MGPGGRETSGGTVAARRDLERLDGIFLTKRRIIISLGVCQLLPASASRLTSERCRSQSEDIDGVDRVWIGQKDWMGVYGTVQMWGVRMMVRSSR